MATKLREKTRYVEMNANKDSFVTKLIGSKTEQDFSDVKLLRSLLSNEKSRILHTLKHQKPKSIYSLAKILGRDFKSVREDLNALERFGFITFFSERQGKRSSLMPVLTVDRLQIQINI